MAKSGTWRLASSALTEMEPIGDIAGSGPGAGSVPVLQHGLSRVLRFPNKVFPLVGRQGREFYFPKFWRRIPQPEEIDWNSIPPFRPSSRDPRLRELALSTPGVSFLSSTSSTTSALAAVYHVVSRYSDLNLAGLGGWCRSESTTFTRVNYRPTILTLHKHDGVYAMDKTPGQPVENDVLMNLGHSMERMLTHTQEQFRDLFLLQPGKRLGDPCADEQAFNYTKIGGFLVRAQLDCMRRDTGEYFDLKSRAVASVRRNLAEYRNHLQYLITEGRGPTNSFEREFYDMVRSCLIKYCFQVRIGRMAGVFVTFHNTETIFGFEYLPLSEMDRFVFGSSYWARLAFDKSFQVLEDVLRTAVGAFPSDDCVKVMFIPEKSKSCLDIVVQRHSASFDPVGWESLTQETFLSKAFGKQGKGLQWSDIGLSEDDVARYRLRVATYVNGRQQFSHIELGDDVEYDLLYNIEKLPLPSPVSVAQSLMRGYDMLDLPRSRRRMDEENQAGAQE
eukprot:Plantae.Rhodophyta-Rhodochaete_pulchella.ctg1550.p1 GENE.Plantae.Rhodophyta-Rhodochaete_pulchella.ctg1550~~Plantae.Rhodophyta-Rhodochaete_pulchella.ctg1550.p1  ORF type:complete len:503 (+),score=58.65 Plantae.Rhodophyta-Rhodochaete_pulchella.ctg1550:204-1712(+)